MTAINTYICVFDTNLDAVQAWHLLIRRKSPQQWRQVLYETGDRHQNQIMKLPI